MPTGLKPRVNEAREFLEIAKDFKDPKEILREAISNSWDACASKIKLKFDLAPIPGQRNKKVNVVIQDDGLGMSSEIREDIGSSEIEGFFNLGDSGKGENQIGSKGHGTKIYYKSAGIRVTTFSNGKKIEAMTEVNPWAALKAGQVPTFQWHETNDEGCGTRIEIDSFETKQKDFSDLEAMIEYIKWYTVAGSFRHFFEQGRELKVEIKPISLSQSIEIQSGFNFPDEQLDLKKGTESVVKIFGPEVISAGFDENGKPIEVEIIGAMLGEDHRSIVPDTYQDMGLWLAKDFIRVERNNSVFEKVFGGQYYYRNFLVFENCQSFDLTANRNNIRRSDDCYDLAIDAITDWMRKLKADNFVDDFFSKKKDEEEERKRQKNIKELEEKEKRVLAKRDERLNNYKARISLSGSGLNGALLKEPKNEAETALLLQAMISSNHPGIDFRIGEYNTAMGVDLLVERNSKGIEGLWWVELVHDLSCLNQWLHSPEGYHAVVCYDIGNIGEKFDIANGKKATLVPKEAKGRYVLTAGDDTYEVYVLRQMLA